MFSIVILFCEILGYSLAFGLVLGLPLAAGPTLYASAIVLVLYASDFLFGDLKIVSELAHGVGIVALIASVATMVRFPQPEFRVNAKVISICIGAFCALLAICLLYLINERARFSRWDEFSHWGTIIRATYEANTFHFRPNPLYFQDYPPGVSLFAYHVLTLTDYTEGAAYFACGLLLLCLSFGALGVSLRLGFVPFLVAGFVLHVSVTVFGVGWSTVLIDQLLGAALGASILICLIARDASKGAFSVPVALGLLVLVKGAGAMLAILAALIGVADLLVVRYSDAGALRNLRLSSGDAIWIVALFTIPVIVDRSWSAYVTAEGLTLGWISYSPIKFVNNVITCCTSSREIEVGRKFFAMLFDVDPASQSPATLFEFFFDAVRKISLTSIFKGPPTPSSIVGALLLSGGMTAAFARSQVLRLRICAVTFFMFLGFLGYSASLLLAYLYAFSDYEARILTSFDRYLNVILLAWLVVNLAMIAMTFSDRIRHGLMRSGAVRFAYGALAIFFVAVAGVPGGNKVIAALWPPGAILEALRSTAPAPPPIRDEVASFTNRIKPRLRKDAKVYIVWQGSGGLHLFVAKYELLPRFTNLFCWSLGEASGPGIKPCQWSANDLAKQLAPFDYLAVGKGLAELRQQFGDIFSGGPADGDQGLFRIQASGSSISLTYVDATLAMPTDSKET